MSKQLFYGILLCFPASITVLTLRALCEYVHNIPGGTSYEPEGWVVHVASPAPPEPDALQLVSSTQVTSLLAPQSVPARTLLSETSWQNPGNSLGSKLNINAGTTPAFYSP